MAITKMYKNFTKSVQIEGVRLEEFEFEVTVGINQGSVLSILLFRLVMDEIRKDVIEGDWQENCCNGNFQVSMLGV